MSGVELPLPIITSWHVLNYVHRYLLVTLENRGTAVAQWLRCCATNRKVAVSIPAGVSGIFH